MPKVPTLRPVGRMCNTITYILDAALEAGTISQDEYDRLWVTLWTLPSHTAEHKSDKKGELAQ